MTAVAALGFQSCTDWDDHYDVTTDGSGVSDQTLWEQISNNPKLSNFAALMKKVGYDKALSTNQSYTVWAPSNDAFDFEKYNAMSDSLLKAEFLNNHIARGYHRATGEINERVHLLNKKVMAFQGNGRILAVVTEGDEQVKNIADSVLEIPQTLNALVPLLSVLPLQILAYYVAVDKGLDVDMPRNLAKSVTVE